MQNIPYTDRDYDAVFQDVKDIYQTLEPRVDIRSDSSNIETILTKIISGCVDLLSYNQDANILEAFPSTARNARSIFDLLSIVGYTPKTARSCKIYLNLWNPSFSGSITYNPYTVLSVDGKSFYNPDSFTCTQGVVTSTEFYQGTLVTPNTKNRSDVNTNTGNFLDYYYPNLSVNTIENDLFALPSSHTTIDSRTIRIYTDDGLQLTYVENPNLVYITKSSFSLVPAVNSDGYSFIFSKDVSSGTVAENYYYFYITSDGVNIANNLTPDFRGFGNPTPNFSYSYIQESSKPPETANEARENIVYEFGWRDTPKAIITRYDAERAILQNSAFVAGVDVRDGDNYSKASPDMFDVQIFIKVTEEAEQGLNVNSAMSYKNRILTHLNRFKALPLSYSVHIDNIQTEEDEDTLVMYNWYPDITIYLKEQVDSKEAGAILQEVVNALFERYNYKNVNFNEVPRIVDIIETVQNASEIILYLDIDGVYYINSENQQVTKEEITCAYTKVVPVTGTTTSYTINLNTLNGTRNIQYHSIKIVDSNNVVIGFDNGDGIIISQTGYLNGNESNTIDYATGELNLNLSLLVPGLEFYVYYKQETPTFCKFTNNSPRNIKIALESIKS